MRVNRVLNDDAMCAILIYTRWLMSDDGKNRIRFGLPFEVVKVFLTVIPDFWLVKWSS